MSFDFENMSTNDENNYDIVPGFLLPSNTSEPTLDYVSGPLV